MVWPVNRSYNKETTCQKIASISKAPISEIFQSRYRFVHKFLSLYMLDQCSQNSIIKTIQQASQLGTSI